MVNEVGKVVEVVTRVASLEVAEPVVEGAMTVEVVDGDEAPAAGVVSVDGAPIEYVAIVDDVVTLAGPSPVALDAGELLVLEPRTPETVAAVRVDVDQDSIDALVPHHLRAMLPDGVRDDADAETVHVELRGSRWTVVDVVGRPALQVWGDPQGRAVEVSDDGLTVYAVDPVNGNRFRASRLGGDDDRLGVLSPTGDLLAGIDSAGRLTARSGVIAGNLLVAGLPLLSEGSDIGLLDRGALGAVAYQRFGEARGPFADGEEWGYAKLGATLRAGRVYRVTAHVLARTNVDGGWIRIYVRAVTGRGNEPTIDSPLAAFTTAPAPESPTLSTRTTLSYLVAYPAAVDLRAMVSVRGFAGATPTVLAAELAIEDLGPKGSYGGGTYTTGREPAPPRTLREYTSTWAVHDWATYDQTGARTYTHDRPTQFSWPGGQQTATALAFSGPAVSGDDQARTLAEVLLAGATVSRVEVRLTSVSWWGDEETGSVGLGRGSGSQLPATLRPNAEVTASGWPRGAGQWVTLPASSLSGQNVIVTLGDKDGGIPFGTFAAPGEDGEPLLRVTYLA